MMHTARKPVLLLITFLTCLLMLSTATAVPMANSEPVMDLVEEQEQIMELSTTIEDIINSDCSLLEKKESLLQLKNNFKDIENFPWGIFLVIVSSYLFMILFPTVAIPMNVILSVILGFIYTIDDFFYNPKYFPPTNPIAYVLAFIAHFIVYSSYNFLLGPVSTLGIILITILFILEDRGILPDQSLTKTNNLTLKNLSLESIDITNWGQV